MHLVKAFVSGALLLGSLLWFGIQHLLLNPMFAMENWFVTNPEEDIFDQLIHDWCRVRSRALTWREMTYSCKDNDVEDPKYETNPFLSQVSQVISKPAGEHTRIRIDTYNNHGFKKRSGGDSFRVLLHGPDTLAASVFDLHNGSYDALALLITPGLYKLQVILDYSLCNGFRDPPTEWYVRAHCSGKANSTLIPSYISSQTTDYIHTEVSPGITINIKKPRYDISMLQNITSSINGGFTCNKLWDGHGVWRKQGRWKDYVKNTDKLSRPQTEPTKYGTLWIYGDSISYYFHKRLQNNTICTNTFQYCENTYNWIYPKKLYELRHFCEDINVEVSRLVDIFKTVLSHTLMDKSSVLIFNLGAHFVKNVSFHKYREIIDAFIEALKKYRGRVIWKSTTAIHAQQIEIMGAFRRFLTSQRVQLFNAYANAAICNAGMNLLDVYPITASFPYGTKDGVHYHRNVSAPVEIMLDKYFRPTVPQEIL